MSKPENILAGFRTYSYHHILVICKNSKIAESLANSDFSEDVEGEYKILSDGRKTAKYVISSVKWQSVFAPSIPNHHGTLMMETHMTIQEPRGVNFLNEINSAYYEFDTDAMSTVFLLKTIFVGYRSDGGIETISNIPPLLMMMYDIEASFDITGAEYSISFCPHFGSMAKLPQLNSASRYVTTMELEKDKYTLKDAMEVLTNKLSVAYNTHFEEIKKELKTDNLKKVRYVIECVGEYTKSHYVIDSANSMMCTAATTKPPISFGKNSTVESAIGTIMGYCSRVKREATEGKERYDYKIVTVTESTDDEIIVTYSINRYRKPISIYERAAAEDKSLITDGNVIEFDYIFSGKNIDIVDFDMKLAMGMVFLQTIAARPTAANSHDDQNIGKSAVSVQNGKLVGDKEPKVTVTVPMPTKSLQGESTTDPITSANFQAELSRHAALEGLDARITIAGNPAFLANLTRLPSKAKKGIPSSFGEVGSDVMLNFDTSPALCKVNIFMPTSDSVTDQDFDQFWYKGYYYLFAVDSVFEDGTFTQTLEMLSIPSEKNIPNNETKITPSKKGISQKVTRAEDTTNTKDTIKPNQVVKAADGQPI